MDSPVVPAGIVNRLDALLDEPREVLWSVDLAAKDLGLALDLVATDGADLVLAATARERYRLAAERGLGENDIAAITEVTRP